MTVHPDRCPHPSAEDAFAAASQAMGVVTLAVERLQEGCEEEAGGGGGAAGGTRGGAGEGGPGSLVPYYDAENLVEQLVWTQNRLAVQAVVLPPEVTAACTARGGAAPGRSRHRSRSSSTLNAGTARVVRS